MRVRRLIAVTLLGLTLISGTALAVRGTTGADEISGTKRGETIRGLEGDDRLSGKGGDDMLAGGPGADVLRGGSGDDRCVTDAEDPDPHGCEDIDGPAGPLRVTQVTGDDRCIILRRADSCYFVIEGMSADEPTGSVAGTSGVRVLAPGGEVSASNGRWTAHGTYACEGDGALEVTIGTELASVAVDCP